MAYTVTKVRNTVYGDERKITYSVTADAATQTIATGLAVITDFNVQSLSMTTSTFKAWPNSSASGVATPGSIGLSGLTSGDQFYLTVFGH